MYYKRWQAYRVITRFPEFDAMLGRGETFIDQLAMVAPIISQSNAKVVDKGISGKSMREVKMFLYILNEKGQVLVGNLSIFFQIPSPPFPNS